MPVNKTDLIQTITKAASRRGRLLSDTDSEEIMKAVIRHLELESPIQGYRFDKGAVSRIDTMPHGGEWRRLIALPLVKEN